MDTRTCDDCFNRVVPNRIIHSTHPLAIFLMENKDYGFHNLYDHCSIFSRERNPIKCPKFKEKPIKCEDCGSRIDNAPFYLTIGRCCDCLLKYMKFAKEIINQEWALMQYFDILHDSNQKNLSKLSLKISNFFDSVDSHNKFRQINSILNKINKLFPEPIENKLPNRKLRKMDSKSRIQLCNTLIKPNSLIKELSKDVHISYSIMNPNQYKKIPYTFFRKMNHTKIYWIKLVYWNQYEERFNRLLDIISNFNVELFEIELTQRPMQEQIESFRRISKNLKEKKGSKLIKNLRTIEFTFDRFSLFNIEKSFKNEFADTNFNLENNIYNNKTFLELIKFNSDKEREMEWLNRIYIN